MIFFFVLLTADWFWMLRGRNSRAATSRENPALTTGHQIWLLLQPFHAVSVPSLMTTKLARKDRVFALYLAPTLFFPVLGFFKTSILLLLTHYKGHRLFVWEHWVMTSSHLIILSTEHFHISSPCPRSGFLLLLLLLIGLFSPPHHCESSVNMFFCFVFYFYLSCKILQLQVILHMLIHLNSKWKDSFFTFLVC